ncbi:MAG: hypothetical protein ACR2QI_04125 [Woeseiaceae bacterium]
MDVNITVSFPEVTLGNGEHISVKTADGRELFVLFEDDNLTVCNESYIIPEDEDEDYGRGKIIYAHKNGTFEPAKD